MTRLRFALLAAYFLLAVLVISRLAAHRASALAISLDVALVGLPLVLLALLIARSVHLRVRRGQFTISPAAPLLAVGIALLLVAPALSQLA